MNEAKLGFEMQKRRLALDLILPVRLVKDAKDPGGRYPMILKSIKATGLIEPLVVHPHTELPGKYLLLDGHCRLLALKELGEREADCIVSIDDECYTYNARVNRLNPIQEHKMIVRAVQNGVKPERIAEALNLPLSQIKASMSLLDNIHVEAADVLKDKPIASKAVRFLRKVQGVRQIEIAELMVSANNYSAAYAEALVLGTPREQLADPTEQKKKQGMSAESIARMEEEMESVQNDLKAVQESYTENMFDLTLARGYIRKLVGNVRVNKWLKSHQPETLAEFVSIAATEGL